ncbi:MAG: hypothetical protein PHT88_04450 [Candidatus Moranbacteria bacterium]|nr:hypothetical protein [Candidatus Moranbacteria bacterium]
MKSSAKNNTQFFLRKKETRQARALRVRRIKEMLMRRKEIPLKVFFITLGALVMTLVVATTKSIEYEMAITDYIPKAFQEGPSPLELEIKEMVKGYPIEDMVPVIAKQDPTVAAFLVSIAKKESNWGKRVPVLNGRDCYNYWGYRGKSEEMGTGGHTCFKTRKEAVTRVAKRIETLTKENKLDTPSEMIVWKCGSSCAGHSEASVSKWIADVSFYFKKFKRNE